MTAAKVNLKEGKNASWFVFGAVIIFQAYLAILFARVDIRPDIVIIGVLDI
jgi:hypothetical protein